MLPAAAMGSSNLRRQGRPAAAELAAVIGVFQWENEKGVWVDYDESTQTMLNAAYRRGRANAVCEKVELKSGYHTYCIDLGTMVQRNISAGTGTERHVRRKEPELAAEPEPELSPASATVETANPLSGGSWQTSRRAEQVRSLDAEKLQAFRRSAQAEREEAAQRRTAAYYEATESMRRYQLQRLSASGEKHKGPDGKDWKRQTITAAGEHAKAKGGWSSATHASLAAEYVASAAVKEIARVQEQGARAADLATVSQADSARAFVESEQTKLTAELENQVTLLTTALTSEKERNRQELGAEKERSDRAASEAAAAAMTDGFVHGLGSLVTKRVDLSSVKFGVPSTTAEMIEAIASCCPDLEAMFLPEGIKLSYSTLSVLRRDCPRALCLELGCEVSEKGYLDLRVQHRHHDAVLSDLLSCAGPPEGTPGPSMRTLSTPSQKMWSEPEPQMNERTVSPLAERACQSLLIQQTAELARSASSDSDSDSGTPLRRIYSDSAEGMIEELKERMKQAIDAGQYDQLGFYQQQITNVEEMDPVVKCRVLDLTKPDIFTGLTDAGFAEIPRLCPDVTAVFLPVNTKVTTAGLMDFRRQTPGVRCLSLGAEISREVLLDVLHQYTYTRRIDITAHAYSNVTAKGLKEIFEFCPEVEAVFTNPAFKIQPQEVAELSKPLPALRCTMLGREVSAQTYQQMEAQLRDAKILDLTGDAFERLSDAGIAELIRMPGLRETLKAIFTDPSNEKVTEDAMLQLQHQCGDQCKCVLLGREISLQGYESLVCQHADTRRLDITAHAYSNVTAKGLEEIVDVWPGLEAVFTRLNSKLQHSDMDNLSAMYTSIPCVVLGCEISPHAYRQIEAQLQVGQIVNLTGTGFEDLSDAGIAELIRMPGLRETLKAIFTDPS
eukprot:COSAG02_NODE_7608_length_2936_cov_1.606274_1_plen_896_part_10